MGKSTISMTRQDMMQVARECMLESSEFRVGGCDRGAEEERARRLHLQQTMTIGQTGR